MLEVFIVKLRNTVSTAADVIRERDFRGFVLKISLEAIASFCDTVVLSERNINNEMCIGRLPCAFGHYHKFAQNMSARACARVRVCVRVYVRVCVCDFQRHLTLGHNHSKEIFN